MSTTTGRGARRAGSVLGVAALVVLGVPGVAMASKDPVGTGAIGLECTSGSYHGEKNGDTTNGTLGFAECDSDKKVTTILVQYHKRSGSKISAQFGWQFTNSDGSSYLNGDTGAVFSQSADTWKHQRFYYSGIARPSGYPCVRGVLYSGGHTFVTKVLC